MRVLACAGRLFAHQEIGKSNRSTQSCVCSGYAAVPLQHPVCCGLGISSLLPADGFTQEAFWIGMRI
jgi:hypothetical protein